MAAPTTGSAPAHDADVLVLGGGPAGTWAALAGARAGAAVVLADKGFCGTSGATASGGNNLWYVPPEGTDREESIRRYEKAGGMITDRSWMARTLELTWEQVGQLADWGYPFPTDSRGQVRRSSLQGPEYMRLMRLQAKRAGVTILDQSPALELLTDADGVVSGARGTRRQHGDETWEVRAGAVILATGGCAFLSGALGCNPDTGDGHLMAAELGVELSGMEFSGVFGMAPAFGAQTKGRMYQFARYYRADGTPVDIPEGLGTRPDIARAALDGPVFARLELAPPSIHEHLRWAQPNFFLPFGKAGVDPFTDLFEVRFVLEGTVRGTGGIVLAGDGCETAVPGLYAAGDAATRELVTGSRSGGGSHNGAWAMSSGTIAGRAAATFARRDVAAAKELRSAARAGIPESGPPPRPATLSPDEVIANVQAEVLTPAKCLFRTAVSLRESLGRLDEVWADQVPRLGSDRGRQKAREAAALTAHARWMYRSSLARPESRGIHRREDRPDTDPALTLRLRTGGLDEVWVRQETRLAQETPPAEGSPLAEQTPVSEGAR
jgi:succinate dehydrogenase/fumarate reductase flavoprotein subunit